MTSCRISVSPESVGTLGVPVPYVQSEIVPIVIKPTTYNQRYLETKEEKMGHKLGLLHKENH